MLPERRQMRGDAAGGRLWPEGSNGEAIQTDRSETSERTGSAAEATPENRSTAASPSAPGRCRLGDGQLSRGDSRPTRRSAAGTRGGRSCQRVDPHSAVTGVMGHGSHRAPRAWLVRMVEIERDICHAHDRRVARTWHPSGAGRLMGERVAGSSGWLPVARWAARLWGLGC